MVKGLKYIAFGYAHSLYYAARTILSKFYTIVALVVPAYMALEVSYPSHFHAFTDAVTLYKNQQVEIQAAVLSSAITIAGVFLSVHFAARQWRKDTSAKRRLEVAGQLAYIIHDMVQAITEIKLFARLTRDLLVEADIAGFYSIMHRYGYWTGQRKNIAEIESRLWVMWHEFNRWTTIGSTALNSMGLCQITSKISYIASSIKIKSSTINIYCPTDQVPDIDLVTQTINLYCVDELIDICEKSATYMSVNSARLTTTLLSDLKEYSWRELVFLIKSAPSFGNLLHLAQTGEANNIDRIASAYNATQNIK